MGDRTYVTLEFQCIHKDIVLPLAQSYDDAYSIDDDDGRFMILGFEEVNYGELPFKEDLRKAGIAYDMGWSDGDAYKAGTEYLRFTEEGECLVKAQDDDAQHQMPMYLLEGHLDQPEALRDAVLAYRASLEILSWADQEEYGKRYLARQLIAQGAAHA